MLRGNLSQVWLQIQENLFPWLQEEIGVLNEKQQQLISILEILHRTIFMIEKLDSDIISHKMSFAKLYNPYNWHGHLSG